jgi:hypothetical protein
MSKGLDYSAGTVTGSTIKAAGYDFVIRYVDDPAVVSLGSKHCRPAEYQDLVKAGVDVWLVFEVGTTDMLAGKAAGVSHAIRARNGAKALGYPPGRMVFMACDMHLTPNQIPQALAYLDGAASVLGKSSTGLYAFGEMVDAAINGDHAGAYWQCGHRPGPTRPVHVYQRNDGTTTVGGITCDINELLRPIPGSSVSGDPTITVEEDMPGPVMNLGEWEPGTAVHKTLSCPVGTDFLFKSGWFSLGVGWADAQDVSVIFVGHPKKDGTRTYLDGSTSAPITLPFDSRLPFKIPSGTELISVSYTSANPVSWSAELLTT